MSWLSSFLSQAPVWLSLLFYAYGFVLIVLLIMDDREPSTTLAWLFVLLFVPVVGVVFYLFLGRDWRVVSRRQGWTERLRRIEFASMAPVYARNVHAAARFYNEWGESMAEPIARAISTDGTAGILPASSIELYNNGASKFRRLKEDLAAAQRFIHMQYFIWEQDELTAEILAILLDRLAAGVEVRVTFDRVGSIAYGKGELRELRRAGAQVKSDYADLLRLNYRNHRKIVVIDGEIGYTGGMNMGQEYIDGGSRFATWRDTHLRLTGQAVAALQQLFAERWFEETYRDGGDIDLFAPKYLPAPDPEAAARGRLVEVVAQGVEDEWGRVRRAHMVAISQAESSVWIQSPYFVPDYSIYDVMINAALSGIDVRFMMAGVPDKRIVFWAAQTYFRRLIEAGARIFLYEAGFLHAKTIVVDGSVSAVGSLNMDNRSLKLHKELMVWMFDTDVAQEVADAFRADMANCHEVSMEDVLATGRLKRFRNQAARLFSRVL